jgi:hypothetical protein
MSKLNIPRPILTAPRNRDDMIEIRFFNIQQLTAQGAPPSLL